MTDERPRSEDWVETARQTDRGLKFLISTGRAGKCVWTFAAANDVTYQYVLCLETLTSKPHLAVFEAILDSVVPLDAADPAVDSIWVD